MLHSYHILNNSSVLIAFFTFRAQGVKTVLDSADRLCLYIMSICMFMCLFIYTFCLKSVTTTNIACLQEICSSLAMHGLSHRSAGEGHARGCVRGERGDHRQHDQQLAGDRGQRARAAALPPAGADAHPPPPPLTAAPTPAPTPAPTTPAPTLPPGALIAVRQGEEALTQPHLLGAGVTWHASAFGLPVLGTAGCWDTDIRLATAALAGLLDADDDGEPDTDELLSAMASRNVSAAQGVLDSASAQARTPGINRTFCIYKRIIYRSGLLFASEPVPPAAPTYHSIWGHHGPNKKNES